jgi:hypothetical protein
VRKYTYSEDVSTNLLGGESEPNLSEKNVPKVFYMGKMDELRPINKDDEEVNPHQGKAFKAFFFIALFICCLSKFPLILYLY